ncbi:MAG TPA: methyltransferase domain-containing protein [Thermoanaerobaculia bacterium]|jgi:SAM-dependent methyltransferase|nr:methyltransferase domain-containing protein [Thermoanaerobaculia bacterium]
MYDRSVQFYDALYGFKDYVVATDLLRRLIRTEHPEARTVLDVACGTGKHIELLRRDYACEGVDINPEILSIARRRCPDVPFHVGDMAGFHLGKRFDVVMVLFSSIAYVKTAEQFDLAIDCLCEHLATGGLLIIEPFFDRQHFWTDRITANFVDQPDLKIAWMYVARREGDFGVLDIHYLVGTNDGVNEFVERHELGLFGHEQYEAAFRRNGISLRFEPGGFFGRGVYYGRRISAA